MTACTDDDIAIMRYVFNPMKSEFEKKKLNGVDLFIKGPIPYGWIQKAAALPGKSLAVGLSLWFLRGLKRCDSFKVDRKARELAGCARQSYSKSLGALAKQGLIELEQLPGKCPVVTLKQCDIRSPQL